MLEGERVIVRGTCFSRAHGTIRRVLPEGFYELALDDYDRDFPRIHESFLEPEWTKWQCEHCGQENVTSLSEKLARIPCEHCGLRPIHGFYENRG